MQENKVKYGIFTKPHHVEKIVNFLVNETSIDFVISSDIHEIHAFDYDIGVSYCFPKIITLGKTPWFNYHPAPLPKYNGLLSYVHGVKDKVNTWAVTLHVMTPEVDSGKIIASTKFPLKSVPVNTNELGSIAHYELFQLFKRTIESLGEIK